MGTVFESASGMRLPDRVASTNKNLDRSMRRRLDVIFQKDECAPATVSYQVQEVDIGSPKVKTPVVKVTVCRLKVCGFGIGLRCPLSMYRRP